MIHFAVTGTASLPYTLPSGYGTIPLFGGNTPYAELSKARFCLSAGSRTYTEYDRQAGMPPVNDELLWGHMRDKGVRHLNAKGTVEFAESTPVVGTDQHGLPLVFDLATQQYFTADSPHVWGESSEILHTVPSYEYTSSGRVYVVAAASASWRWTFHGDQAIIVGRIERPERRYKDNNQVSTAGSVMGTMYGYHRYNGQIYYHTPVSRIGTYYTSAEQSVHLAAVPLGGGALLSRKTLQTVNSGPIENEMDYVIDAIRDQLGQGHLHLDEHPTDFGELGLECAAQLKFVDQNILLLALDVDDWRHFHTLWKNLVDSDGWARALRAAKSVAKGKGKAEDIPALFRPGSSTYLFGKYAVLPSVSDVKRLFEGAQRSSLYTEKQRLHSRRITSIDDPSAISASHTAVLTVQCGKYPDSIAGRWQELISGFKRWGAWPSVENLWDVLPYSFVADWFVQFGDLFKDITAFQDMENYFPIEYAEMSEKWSVRKSITTIAPLTTATGVVDLSYYVRWIGASIPLPSVSLSVESVASRHWLESTALFLQRL